MLASNRTATLLASLAFVTGSALGQPTTIELDGTVRDFKKSHADFDVAPADGMGHYAANVGLTLGVDDRPVFSGGGFKVGTQWTNYPIDGLLYGDEYDDHNYNFTYAIEAAFEFEGCQGQFIELSGADDIWLFVDGQLVIDLGGIEPGTEQVIEMDRLGLTDAGLYTVHLFYANRHGGGSGLHVRTNIELWGEAR